MTESGDSTAADDKELKMRQREEEKQQRTAERAQKARERADARDAKASLKREIQARNEELYGKKVIEEVCAGKTVRIYDKGYVQIYMLFGSSAPYEKLLGISASADVAKKTGLGRALAAAATGGANLVYTSNKRGDLYLAITTDQKVHMIHESPPTERSMKAMHKLANAGQAVLDATAALHVTPVSSEQPTERKAERSDEGSIVDQLTKLAQLSDSGVLTEVEFEAAKAKLLH